MKAGIREFDKVKAQLTNVKGEVAEILKTLDRYDSGPPGKPFDQKRLESIFKSLDSVEGGKAQITARFGQLARQSELLTEAVEKLLNQEENDWSLEIEKKNTFAQWERMNTYKMWFHKTIRWIAGAALVVLMYSTAVWLHDKCDFIKVPIHDLVTGPKSEPQ